MQEEGLESNLVSMRVGFGVGFLRFQPLTVDWISLLFFELQKPQDIVYTCAIPV